MIPYFRQPELPLGPFAIHAFGVLVVLGIFLGARLLRGRARGDGLDEETAVRLVSWTLVGGFIGAHLVDRLVYFPRDTLADPVSLLKVWAGISSFGGFLGAIVGSAIFVRREQLGALTWRYLDAVAYAFPFGWTLGRLGCFTAFDHPGLPTDFFLGQRFKDGVVRHNLGLEEALFSAAIAILFLALGRRRRTAPFFTGLLAVVYAPVRFSFDFLRTVDVRYLGLTPGQYGALALLGVGVALLALGRRRARAASAAAA